MRRVKSRDSAGKVAVGGRRAELSNRPSPIDEVRDALKGEIASCAARAVEHALLLESIGAQSLALTSEIVSDAESDELVRLSHRIRGVVAHALDTLAELQCVAGRLDALGAIRATEPTLEAGGNVGE